MRYTVYRRIYERFSFLTRWRGQNGRILRHSRAMSGSAGLSPSRNRKPEGSTLNGYARNLREECAGPVAGQAVLTAEIRIEAVEDLGPIWIERCATYRKLVSPDKAAQSRWLLGGTSSVTQLSGKLAIL